MPKKSVPAPAAKVENTHVVTLKHHNVQAAHSLPNPCFQPSDRSVNLIVENNSAVNLVKPTMAFYSFQDDFWRKPIVIAEKVRPGRRVVKSIEDENVRIFHMKLKYEAETKIYKAEEVASYPWYIKCVILTVKDDMSYSVGIVWSYLPGA